MYHLFASLAASVPGRDAPSEESGAHRGTPLAEAAGSVFVVRVGLLFETICASLWGESPSAM